MNVNGSESRVSLNFCDTAVRLKLSYIDRQQYNKNLLPSSLWAGKSRNVNGGLKPLEVACRVLGNVSLPVSGLNVRVPRFFNVQ